MIPDADAAIKILDFGLARSLDSEGLAVDSVTARGGTLRYMAPEQLAAGFPTPLWDLWALAVIAYEMLTGAHPIASTAESMFVRCCSPAGPNRYGCIYPTLRPSGRHSSIARSR